MNLRPRQEQGTLLWNPETYGRSHLGLPLEVWRPRGPGQLRMFAAIHGEEAETTGARSRALRHLAAERKRIQATAAFGRPFAFW